MAVLWLATHVNQWNAKHTRLDHKLHYSVIIVLFFTRCYIAMSKQMEENMEIINMVDITKKHSMAG